MKETGIVRRIDDLGRVIIPKELRRLYQIGDGDPVQFYTDPNGIIGIKLYAPDYSSMCSTTENTILECMEEDKYLISEIEKVKLHFEEIKNILAKGV